MTSLKHAEIICHMANHGFESVEHHNLSGRAFKADYQCNPITCPNLQWHIKPATITYTVTVPEPLRVMPKYRANYWIVISSGVNKMVWQDDAGDNNYFEQGNIWDTEAKAQQAFDALFSPLKATK